MHKVRGEGVRFHLQSGKIGDESYDKVTLNDGRTVSVLSLFKDVLVRQIVEG